MSNTILFCRNVKNKTQRYTTLIFVPKPTINITYEHLWRRECCFKRTYNHSKENGGRDISMYFGAISSFFSANIPIHISDLYNLLFQEYR